MLIVRLAALVMQANPAGPVFTADAEVLMKLILFAGAIIGGVYALWYKAHLAPIRSQLTAMTDPTSPDRLARHSDVNGLGERVDRVEGEIVNQAARQGITEATVRDHSRDLSHAAEQLGRVMTWVEQCGRDTQVMKEEIIGFASQRFDTLSREIADVKIQVAVVTEQVREMKEDQREERRGKP